MSNRYCTSSVCVPGVPSVTPCTSRVCVSPMRVMSSTPRDFHTITEERPVTPSSVSMRASMFVTRRAGWCLPHPQSIRYG